MSWNKKADSEKYYSNFPKKLILDYIKGNPRTIAAINFFLSQINEQAKNILDVGCGIGWSSYEMVSKSNAKVVGIDLSENSIKAGTEIFKNNKLKFEKKDIITDDFGNEKYDLITFLDVFEHVPKEKREVLYSKLKQFLAPKSKILLTCPTVYHQEHLRKNNPEGLQPVDEDINLKILGDFAKAVDGEITFFSYKSIWHKSDYFHCVIELGIELSQKRRELSPSKVYGVIERSKLIENSIFKKEFESELIKEKKTPLIERIIIKFIRCIKK